MIKLSQGNAEKFVPLISERNTVTMDTEYELRLGKNIRRIRMEQRITQDTLAAKMQLAGCDITRSALAKIEAGQRHIYADEIRLFKELLNISYNELLDI